MRTLISFALLALAPAAMACMPAPDDIADRPFDGTDYIEVVDAGFFHRGSQSIKDGHALAEQGDLEGARVVWRRTRNVTDKRIRGRALYNIALAQHLDGQSERAEKVARRAAETLPTRRVTALAEALAR